MKSQLSGEWLIQSYRRLSFLWNQDRLLLQINDGPKPEGRKSAENKPTNSTGAAKRIVASAKKDTVSGTLFFYAFSLVTSRVRSTTGGYVFTGVCLFNFRGGGTPSSWPGGRGVPHPRSGLGGEGGLVPHPRSGCGGGGLVPHPRSGGGVWYPIPGLDGGGGGWYPSQVWRRGWFPIPGLDRGYPWPELDEMPPSPSRTGWGTRAPLDRAA